MNIPFATLKVDYGCEMREEGQEVDKEQLDVIKRQCDGQYECYVAASNWLFRLYEPRVPCTNKDGKKVNGGTLWMHYRYLLAYIQAFG